MTEDGRGWKDHGTGEKGNIIDLVMKLENLSPEEAVDRLLSKTNSPSLSSDNLREVSRSLKPKNHSNPTAITSVRVLKHPALIDYLKERRIPLQTARKWVKEVHYRHLGRSYFAVGLKNLSDGFALRNKHSKRNIHPQDIATPWVIEDSSLIAVFEGMMDLLSFHALNPLRSMNTLVLNSTNMSERAISYIQSKIPTRVELYLDHDQAGRESTDLFVEKLSALGIT